MDANLNFDFSHLNEIKKLAFRIVLVWGGIFGLSFVWQKEIYAILTKPLGTNLYFLSPFESLDFIFKTQLLVSFLIALPIILILIYRFTQDIFYENEKKTVFYSLISIVTILVFAISYGYWLLVPTTLHALKELTPVEGTLFITANNYLNFLITIFFCIMVAFNLPIINYTLIKNKIVKPETVESKRRVIYFGAITSVILFTGAIDILSISLMVIPLALLFEFSIWLARR